MQKKAVTTVNALTYKHFMYQEDILEGNTDPVKIQSAYDGWSSWCVITAITPKYLRIELPDKTCTSEPVSYYADYELRHGYWVVCSDYDKDIDQFYWCNSKGQALVRAWLLRCKCKGPHLIHTIDLRCID